MATQGFFKARAFTSSAELPVANVTVTVEQELPNGGSELLSVQMTDRSGLTRPVSIPTPEETLSEAPEQARGWTAINVFADHPDYERLQLFQVQVFPNTTTVQNLALLPLAELPESWSQQEILNTPAQNL